MKNLVSVERFFNLFMEELELNAQLTSYYKFHENKDRFLFRKAYFCQRLEFIISNIKKSDTEILDLGCGYGTTAIFLALNGFKVKGLTLEFYDEAIPKRIEYWKDFGDTSLFEWSYQNIYDEPPEEKKYHNIISQDTLHHLEPCNEALKIIRNSLSDNGKLITVEENGDNLILRALLYKQRGGNRVIKVYDEKLKKEILLGNENIRGLKEWTKLFEDSGLKIDEESIKYIRFYFPNSFKKGNYEGIIRKENTIGSPLLHKYFFYSLNFTAERAVI